MHSLPAGPTSYLPSQLRYRWVALVSVFIAALQLASGTGVLFVCLNFMFNWLTALTFNELGGLRTVTGIAVTAMAAKTVIFSQVVKILIWQPADVNLFEPSETILVMVMGMLCVLAAASSARLLVVRQPLVQNVSDPRSLLMLCILAMLISVTGELLVRGVSADSTIGRMVFGVSMYTKIFASMSTIAGTAYTLVVSGNRRCFGLVVAIPMAVQLLFGLLSASKQVMYTPLFAHALTCAAFGFRFRLHHFFTGGIVAALCLVVLYPLSQAGRVTINAKDLSANWQQLLEFIAENMSDWDSLHQLSAAITDMEGRQTGAKLYYGTSMGIIDRFSLIAPSDRLIAETMRSGREGVDFLWRSFELLPRSVTGATSDVFVAGNYLGKKTAIISRYDDVTSIAFSVFAEVYHCVSWPVFFCVLFFTFFIFFLMQKKWGDHLSHNVWAIVVAVLLQHLMAESSVQKILFYTIRTAPFILILYYLVMPCCLFLGRLFMKGSSNATSASLKDPTEVKAA